MALTSGFKYPWADDWAMVPAITGEQPLTAQWLWAQHNEHRIPLPKLALVLVGRTAGADCRAGMVFNVGVLAALAAAMILTARQLRGYTAWWDAYFVLALLHLGQNAIWWDFYAQFLSSTALACVFLLLVVRHRDGLTPLSGILAALGLVLLPLCGANGLPFVPLMGMWVVYAAPRRPRSWLVAVSLLVAAAVLLTGCYFLGYERPSWHPPSRGLADACVLATRFLGAALGPQAARGWPVSGILTLGILLAGLAGSAVAWGTMPGERRRAGGLLLFLTAFGGLAGAVGWGRSGRGWSPGFEAHYETLGIPLLCCAYFICLLYLPPGWRNRVQQALFCLGGAIFLLHVPAGVNLGRIYRDRTAAVDNDLRAGTPAFVLAERQLHLFYHEQTPDTYESVVGGLRMLRHAKMGPLGRQPEDPILQEVSYLPVPAVLEDMRWEEGVGTPLGRHPAAIFRVSHPRFVYAIRLEYRCGHGGNTPTGLRVGWHSDRATDFSREERFARVPRTGGAGDGVATAWVNDCIEAFRIAPDDPKDTLSLRHVTLLVPAVDPPPDQD